MSASLIEARAWIKSTGRFAPSRFESREEALDFVYKLYRSGAIVVSVSDACTLNIELPDDEYFRDRILTVCNDELERRGGGAVLDSGQSTVEINWSGVSV